MEPEQFFRTGLEIPMSTLCILQKGLYDYLSGLFVVGEKLLYKRVKLLMCNNVS